MNGPTAADFLAARFARPRFGQAADGTLDHWIEIRTFHKDGTAGPRFWEDHPARAAARVAKLAPNLAVYYGVAGRCKGGGKKADVTSILGAWADVDDKHFPDGRAGALAAIEAFALPPTWIVDSGGGTQVYWDFTDPITDPARFPAFEALLARLYQALGGVDRVQDVSRVFRVPGTRNTKYQPPRPVTIAQHNPAALYTVADLEQALPAPEPQERPRPAYPTGNHRTGDIPTHDEVREMLRCIPPQSDYREWLTTLASVHSVFPGSAGVALCEEWSPGKPGEVERKFASFHRDPNSTDAASVGSLVYEAKRYGYRPARGNYGNANVFSDPDLIATLRADVARLGDLLRERDATIAEQQEWRRRRDEEDERTVLRLTQLEEENRMLHETRQHGDQTVAANVWDAAAALKKRYGRGEVKTEDGQDLAPVISKYDAKTGSPATLGRCITRLEAAGVTVRRYEKTIKTEAGNDKQVKIPHFFIPPEHRHSVPAIVRFLLPPSPEKKKQGGSKKRIQVPVSTEHPFAPLIRRHETIETFRSMVTPGEVIPGSERLLTASETYWTKDGDPLTQHEAIRIQVGIGHEPPPWWNTTARPDRLQVDDLPKYGDGIQLEIVPEPEPPHGRCHCGRPNLPPGKDTRPRQCSRHEPGGLAWGPIFEQGYVRTGAD